MKPETCKGCPLEFIGEGFVPPQGTGEVMLCGEAPGETEAKLGVPFIGMAGAYLDRTLGRIGVSRTAFTITNTIWCRPPHNVIKGWEAAQQHCYEKHLKPLIDQHRPRSIVALGGEPLRVLTGYEGISKSRGFICSGPNGVPTIGTYHPAFLMPRFDRPSGIKDPWRLTGAAILDIKAALAVDRNYVTPVPTYLEDPLPDRVRQWVDEALASGEPVMFDIETPGKAHVSEDDIQAGADRRITRIGFAQRGQTSISFPWEVPYIREAGRLLEGANTVVGWNSYAFDEPILNEHGVYFTGKHHDAMWMWHFVQSDLPRGLAFASGVYARTLRPWKHLSMAAPAFYNAQDAEVTLRCFEGIQRDLKAARQWEIYERHVVQLWPILRRAGETGLLIDTTAQAELRRELEGIRDRLLTEAQELVPDGIKPVKLYKKFPSGSELPIRETTIEGKLKRCSKCGATGVTKTDHLRGGKKNPCAGAEIEVIEGIVPAWEEIQPFNLGSSVQMMGYARFKGHPLPIDHETGRPTLDSLALEKLARDTKDPLYAKVLEYRDADKTVGTFIFPADSNNRIHTTYTFATSTGRLSSRDVNLQNVSHHSTWSKRVRDTIIAPPGYCFVEADSSAIEAVMTGYFADDPVYMKLAKTGIHDYLTCLELGLEFDPAKVKVYRKSTPGYEDARNRNKRTIHGTNYGMTPKTMVAKFPDIFPKVKDAATAQRRYLDACPKLVKWQENVRQLAASQGYLENPWRYRHYYYHIYDKRGGHTRLGEDAKRCVSFLPQSSAAAFIKDSAIEIAGTWLGDYIPANFLIHDSYCVIVPKDRADEAQDLLIRILTRPIPEMDGLRIGCEVKQSDTTWGNLRVTGGSSAL